MGIVRGLSRSIRRGLPAHGGGSVFPKFGVLSFIGPYSTRLGVFPDLSGNGNPLKPTGAYDPDVSPLGFPNSSTNYYYTPTPALIAADTEMIWFDAQGASKTLTYAELSLLHGEQFFYNALYPKKGLGVYEALPTYLAKVKVFRFFRLPPPKNPSVLAFGESPLTFGTAYVSFGK